MEKITNTPITPIQPLPGDWAPLTVINTEATRGGNGSHSTGGKGTCPQGHVLRKTKKKNQRWKSSGSRSQVPPWRTTVLHLEFKPWPLVIGAPSSHVQHFVVFLHEGPFLLKYWLRLRCEGHLEFNSIFIQQSHLVVPSPLVLPFLIALACLCTVHLFLCW